MFDLAHVNAEPGTCGKCRGSGKYRWGAVVNGKAAHAGACHSCGGTGRQSAADIKRNAAYNRFKIARIAL